MNSFGQNEVELLLIWSLEDCHFLLFSLTTIERVKKIITEAAGPESQLSLNSSQNSLGCQYGLRIFQPVFFLQHLLGV